MLRREREKEKMASHASEASPVKEKVENLKLETRKTVMGGLWRVDGWRAFLEFKKIYLGMVYKSSHQVLVTFALKPVFIGFYFFSLS